MWGSYYPPPRDCLGIKGIEPRRSGRHAGETGRENNISFNPGSIWFSEGRPAAFQLSGKPCSHTTADTICSGDSIKFGWISHAVYHTISQRAGLLDKKLRGTPGSPLLRGAPAVQEPQGS